MADIELVIKISEEVYKHAKEIHEVMCDSVWLGIKNGTPLPKGHGRLIDADELLEQQYRIDDSAALSIRDVVNVEDVEDTSTIIEADTESEV